MKLFDVWERRPLEKRERKVRVFRYIVMAETLDEAIATAKRENRDAGGTWEGHAIEDDWRSVATGCSFQDPRPEEL